MKAFLSWSTGKDSAWSLHTLQEQGVEVIGLLTTVSESAGRVPMHHVEERFLDMQADAAELPLIKIPLPSPCPNEIYEARMKQGVERMKRAGAEAVAFGDLFLEDIRAYREAMMEGTGLELLFPLWGRDTEALSRDMVAGRLRAVVTAVDSELLDPAFVGRWFDDDFLDSLPDDVDPCAENGEFHTFACAGPMFREQIPVVPRGGGRWERIVYVDLEVEPAF